MAWLIGFICALAVAGAAFYKNSLTLSGMCAAVIMGTVYYGAGNVFWFGTLLLFFITSTLLSKWKGRRKEELEKSYAKTGRRDAGQVMANGGLGMLVCLLNWIWPEPLWAYAFIGIMASVTADTWATEVGGLSRRPPRSVLTWKVLAPGTSGGVSWLGSAAAAAGACVIGAGAWLLLRAGGLQSGSFWIWLAAGGIGGLAGAFTDSVLGASLQRMYRCPVCGREVEVPVHCGVDTVPSRGLTFMNNDVVNLLSSLMGGLIAFIIGFIAS
ncbi:DUF92 domain-containing protein [Paenibacillus tuaregi]|uniref:DUF92 domain-containing protein n=1 Tax=Paenibacillus tuaregi TaxID=1816681 RepID=UPI000837ADEB|nr:DUF92 domain-containing protein [Paenibacillus tuaregi]